MNKTQHYVLGQWADGKGEGVPVCDSITGKQFTSTTTEGLDIPSILQYGRVHGETLRKMTFQERGNMLKSLAMYLVKKISQNISGKVEMCYYLDLKGLA